MREEEKDGLKKFIKRKVIESGYALELETSRTLWSHGWLTFGGGAYSGETGRVRSIDISAEPPDMLNLDKEWKVNYEWGKLKGALSPFILNPELCVECKRSENTAWVFFRGVESVGPIFTPDFCGQIYDDLNRLWQSNIVARGTESDSLTSHYKSAGGLATSFAEVRLSNNVAEGPPTKKQGRREIYTAVMQLLNYIVYDYKNNARERDYILYDFKYPMIVFDGKMYAAELRKGEVEVDECQHIVLEQVHVDRELWGHESRTFYIDVVTTKALPTLLDAMREDILAFSKLFVDGMEERRTKLKRLMNKERSKRARDLLRKLVSVE